MSRGVAYVPDLMDRSRLAAFDLDQVRTPGELADAAAGADLVVVDLSRPGVVDAAVALVAPGVRVIGFAPHVDDELRRRAAAGGVEVLARSRFFGHLAEVLSPPR